jgi:integrase/recombinase XerC/integrase/recombinase XerD
MSHELIQEFLDSNPFANTTKVLYGGVLKQVFAETGTLTELTSGLLRKFIDRPNWGDNRRWAGYCAIKSFYKWHFGNADKLIKFHMKKPRETPQRSLDKDQVIKLFAILDPNKPKDIRDRAAILLMIDTGMRISEVCSLRSDQVDLTNNNYSVLAKGGRWHTGIFSVRTSEAIDEWLLVRCDFARADTPYLFVSVGGNTRGGKLIRGGYSHELAKLGPRAGIGVISPHDFRRTFAILSCLQGVPEVILMRAGGWTSTSYIARYTQTMKAEDFRPYLPSNAVF